MRAEAAARRGTYLTLPWLEEEEEEEEGGGEEGTGAVLTSSSSPSLPVGTGAMGAVPSSSSFSSSALVEGGGGGGTGVPRVLVVDDWASLAALQAVRTQAGPCTHTISLNQTKTTQQSCSPIPTYPHTCIYTHYYIYPPHKQALQSALAQAEAAWQAGTRPEVIALDVEWRPGIYGTCAFCCVFCALWICVCVCVWWFGVVLLTPPD